MSRRFQRAINIQLLNAARAFVRRVLAWRQPRTNIAFAHIRTYHSIQQKRYLAERPKNSSIDFRLRPLVGKASTSVFRSGGDIRHLTRNPTVTAPKAAGATEDEGNACSKNVRGVHFAPHGLFAEDVGSYQSVSIRNFIRPRNTSEIATERGGRAPNHRCGWLARYTFRYAVNRQRNLT